MADRLRELIDLVLGSIDEPGANGRALALRANFSRDHLDRLLNAATGETPAALRRRLLLERAAWQLRNGAATPSEAAATAGYGSLAAFSRAFARAYGAPPSEFAGAPELDAPNGIHFHPPAGLLIPGTREPVARRDLTDRMVSHHLARVRELLELAATLPAEALERPLRPGFEATWFEGEEPSAAVMAERLVFTIEIWNAAMTGDPVPEGRGDLLPALRPRGPRASHAWRERSATAAPGTTPSSTHCASRRSRSPTAASSRTSSATEPSAARRSPPC